MKKFIPLMILAALISVACEKDNETQFQDEQLDLKVEKNDSQNSNRVNSPQVMSDLERKMGWTAFIATEAIMKNNAARTDFISEFGSGTVVDVANLLGDSEDRAFKDEFIYRLELYINNPCTNTSVPPIGCPITGTGNPPPPVEGGSLANQFKIEKFLDYITEDNCLEFFLPKALIIHPAYTITSVAHPLNISTFNEGYRRSLVADPHTGQVTNRINIVGQSYAQANNVIVVRPERKMTPGDECDYSEYSTVDFTDFLGDLLGGL